MRRTLGWAGAVVGGWIGWSAGAAISVFAAFMIGLLGTGLGMYAGYRLASRYF